MEKIMRLMLVALALGANTALLPAQAVVPIGIQNSSEPRLTTPRQQSTQSDRDPKYLARVGPAAVVGLVGAMALGATASAVTPCRGDCYGQLAVVLTAGLFGGILGSAAGAAAPRGRGLCTGVQRFGMGVGGAFLGALAGLPLGTVSGPFGLLVTVPVGSVMFMRRC